MSGPFNTIRTCRVPTCGRMARGGASGMCGIHASTWKGKHVSDGVNPAGSTLKLSAEQVAEARRMLSAFKSKREIAKHFGITPETLNRYLRKPKPPLATLACLLLALVLTGCGAGIRDDSGTDGVVTNPCAELDTPPAGCE